MSSVSDITVHVNYERTTISVLASKFQIMTTIHYRWQFSKQQRFYLYIYCMFFSAISGFRSFQFKMKVNLKEPALVFFLNYSINVIQYSTCAWKVWKALIPFYLPAAAEFSICSLIAPLSFHFTQCGSSILCFTWTLSIIPALECTS